MKTQKLIIEVLLRVFGASVILPRKIYEILELTGLNKEDIKQVLSKIKSLSAWQKEWELSADDDLLRTNSTHNTDEAKYNFYKAASKFCIAHMFLNPADKEKQRLIQKVRLAYQGYGKLEGTKFEQVSIDFEGQMIYGYFQHPRKSQKAPAILLLPHLGGIKEEIDFISNHFLNAGFATLRIDLPGCGETTGVLPLDAERICSSAIKYLYERPDVYSDQIISLGISFGAYWTMKAAAIDRRIKLAIGISTPAMTPKQWDKMPEHNWLFFQQCFGKKDLVSTRKIAEQLTLWGIMDKIQCPILLIHGQRDTINDPRAIEMLTQDTRVQVDTRIYPKSGHGCLDMLRHDVLPFAVQWCKKPDKSG